MIPRLLIAGFEISTYWLMFLVGVFAMAISTMKRRNKYALSSMKSNLFVLFLTVVGLLGAKLLYCIEEFDSVLKNGLTLGGVSFFGSVFLIPLAMPLLGRLLGLRPMQTLDLCAPNIAVMIACMRTGCFFTGCCGGHIVTWFGFRFTLPAQLLEIVFDLWIFSFLLSREKNGATKGGGYPTFLVAYGILRFFLEFVRTTEKDWIGMSHGQWFSLVSVLCGGLFLFYLNRSITRGDSNVT